MNKLKILAILQTIIIIILIFTIITKNNMPKNGLLSPRVYTGLLKPKSLLITNFEPLKEDILDYINNSNDISIYIQNLRDGSNIGINEENFYPPFSLNKVPLAIMIMKKVESGELKLNEFIMVNDSEKSVLYGNLYKTNNNKLELKFLLEKMLKESDNTAMNVLLKYIDDKNLKLLSDYYPIDLTVYYPEKRVYKKENYYYITPKIMVGIFQSLYLSTILEKESSEYILSLLTNTLFNLNSMADIPDSVKISNKFGLSYYEKNKFFHDCGIMYIKESKIAYCIMTKNLDKEEAQLKIVVIVKKIYVYTLETRAFLDTYK